MLFNSYEFIFLFLPVVLIGYFSLNKIKLYMPAKVFLLAASLFFYGYFKPIYLVIIVSSILINYFACKIIKSVNQMGIKRVVFAIVIFINIFALFMFKYYDFTIRSINWVTGSEWDALNIMLPLGISFFTFQQLSYVIDSYYEKLPDYKLLDYSIFVTYFPQLIAGPIVLHDELVPQMDDLEKKKINYDNLAKGIFAFSLGLAKKVLLADKFGVIVDYGYNNIDGLGVVNAIMVILSYTLQIYFDFSGYCNMATGIGLMMNIDLPMNFNSPYKATDAIDFWKRWHMTLTRFFTTYIYVPLGGSRKGNIRTYFNIMVVFVVSGIWHGANWTFIVWGMIWGVAQVMTRIMRPLLEKIPKVLMWFVTFIFVNLTWVIFRADSLTEAKSMFAQLANFDNLSVSKDIMKAFQDRTFVWFCNNVMPIGGSILKSNITYVFILLALFISVVPQSKNCDELTKDFKPNLWCSVLASVLIVVSIMSLTGISTFLYWNF